jgi:hypothetical protein
MDGFESKSAKLSVLRAKIDRRGCASVDKQEASVPRYVDKFVLHAPVSKRRRNDSTEANSP